MEINAAASCIAMELKSSGKAEEVSLHLAEGEVYAQGPEFYDALLAAVRCIFEELPGQSVEIKTGFGSGTTDTATGQYDHVFLSIIITLPESCTALAAELSMLPQIAELNRQLQEVGGVFLLRCNAQGRLQALFSLLADEASETDACSSDGNGKTVLLVEDEDFVRNVTREVLEMSGYTVLEAMSGDVGIEIFRKQKGLVDLLLTDVVMPGMNGRDLAVELFEINPKLKTIFMSGYTETSIVFDGEDDERISFLQKPFALDTLTQKVKEVLEGA